METITALIVLLTLAGESTCWVTMEKMGDDLDVQERSLRGCADCFHPEDTPSCRALTEHGWLDEDILHRCCRETEQERECLREGNCTEMFSLEKLICSNADELAAMFKCLDKTGTWWINGLMRSCHKDGMNADDCTVQQELKNCIIQKAMGCSAAAGNVMTSWVEIITPSRNDC